MNYDGMCVDKQYDESYQYAQVEDGILLSMNNISTLSLDHNHTNQWKLERGIQFNQLEVSINKRTI